jgi:NADPH-dependent 2,4-dienoyl-CoA reductase/sulfur reductase-like enzyme
VTVLERVVVVGASLAGLRAAQTLRLEGFTGLLTVIGEEPHPPYRRPSLSKELLAGEIGSGQVLLGGDEDLEAEWLLGRRAAAVDLRQREVMLDDGERLKFDGLVIATGAAAKRLPNVPELEGVHVVRTLEDAQALRKALTAGRPRVVVIGAGFIGSEVASSCRALGGDVTVIDPLPHPLAPLGSTLGQVCAGLQRDHGVDLRLGRSVVGFEGHDRVQHVRLDDGTTLDADVVVIGIGTTPATGWLQGSGLRLDDGVVCHETLAVLGCEHVVAAGDVTRWPHRLFDGRLLRVEHWTNAVDQGAAAAKTLLASPDGTQPFAVLPSFWSEQFGTRIQSIGLPQLADHATVVAGSLEERRFLAVYTERGRMVGAVAFDMPRALAAAKGPLLRRESLRDLTLRA